MPHYSARSAARLNACHPDIRKIFETVIAHFDHTILCGHRGREQQDKAFRTRRTKVQYPDSKHNSLPSLAVDAAPYPVNWNDRERFHLFAGFVLGTARAMGVDLRWGGDWDQDTEVADNGFDDLPHFELNLEKDT